MRYVTGRGGRVNQGLSAFLSTLTSDYRAVAVDSVLLSLPMDEQLAIVRGHIVAGGDEFVIATSYGAYLTLLALVDAQAAPARLLMLSPLLGRSTLRDQWVSFRPPRERLLKAAVEEGRITRPDYLEILTGAEDPICCPELARNVADKLQADAFTVLPGATHDLPKKSVSEVVFEFLER